MNARPAQAQASLNMFIPDYLPSLKENPLIIYNGKYTFYDLCGTPCIRYKGTRSSEVFRPVSQKRTEAPKMLEFIEKSPLSGR